MIDSMFRRLLGLRSGGEVVRLHTVRTILQHNVAEHTFGAMLIGRELCEALGINPLNVMTHLLYHDVDEVATGDVPAPVKWANPGLAEQYKKIAEEFNDLHGVPIVELSDTEKKIVKAADYGDLAFRCLQEMKMGNRTQEIKNVFGNCLRVISEMNIEVIDYLVVELNKERSYGG